MSRDQFTSGDRAGRARLGEWVEAKLRERGWSQRQAEEQTGLKRSTLSFIIRAPNGHRHEQETLINLARAFNEPVWSVFEMAGIPLELPETINSVLRRLQSLADQNHEYQELLLLLAEMDTQDVRAVLSLLIGSRRLREEARTDRQPAASSVDTADGSPASLRDHPYGED